MTRSNERYSRQVLCEKIGPEGQAKLAAGRVAVIGCGALGSGIAHNLVRAGVGKIRIVDRDRIELSNLARQVLYREQDVADGLYKVEAAAKLLREINSDCEIEEIVADVNASNIDEFIRDVDAVADGSDNMPLRFVVNEACVRARTPWVYGGAVASGGMSMTILPGRTPCLRCIVEELPPPGTIKTANDIGVLNTLTSIISAIESNEILKLLIGSNDINPDLIRFDVWDLVWRRSIIKRRSDCPVCADTRPVY